MSARAISAASGKSSARGRARIERMRHGESQASQIVRRGAECGRCDLVQASGIRRRNIQRALARPASRRARHDPSTSGIFNPLAISMGCWRTDWRTANAILGATLVMSSPRMNTASHSSISRSVGVRMGPRRRISIMRPTSFASSSAMPEWKWSGPTRVRRAKLASSDARGEPIPITLPFATLSLRCCRADAAEVGCPFSTGWRIRRSLLTNS